jgi:hypothetical protein
VIIANLSEKVNVAAKGGGDYAKSCFSIQNTVELIKSRAGHVYGILPVSVNRWMGVSMIPGSTWLVLSVFLILVSCTDQGGENLENGESVRIVLTRTIELPGEYQGGEIIHLDTCGDSLLIFSDYFLRELTLYNARYDSIAQLGSLGRGPGEYMHPTYLRTGIDCSVAFSDMTNSNTTIVNIEGNLLETVSHQLGGGRKFDFRDDAILYLGTGQYLLYVYDRSHETFDPRIEIDAAYRRLIQYNPGGGIRADENIVYLMNSIEPIIYQYDLTSGLHVKIIPNSWNNCFPNNFDADAAAAMTEDRWRKARSEYAHFIHFDVIKSESGPVFVVFYRFGDTRYIELVDRTGETLDRFPTEKFFLGCSESGIYLYEFERNENSYKALIHEYAIAHMYDAD